jgi:hypothetical protein
VRDGLADDGRGVGHWRCMLRQRVNAGNALRSGLAFRSDTTTGGVLS